LPLPTGDPPRAFSLSWSVTRSTWPLPNHLPRRRPGPSRCRRWASTACASFERQAPIRADDQPVVDTVRATTPTPAVLAVWLLAASARLTNSPGSDTADAERPDSGRRMPRCPDAQLDTGRRTPTPDSGHLDAHTGHWTPHRSRDIARVDTGRSHRTLGRRMLLRTGQADKARPAPDFLGTTPSGCPLGRRTVFLRTAPAALGVPCRLGGEATCQYAKTAYRAVRQLLGRLAGQAAPRRTALLGRFRVERRARRWRPSGIWRRLGVLMWLWSRSGSSP
jgi:hypothetical protein